MKRKLSLLFLLMMGLFFATACSDDDDDNYNPNYNPNQEVRDAFNQMFPNATQVNWGEKDNYAVANFVNNEQTTTAWFSKQGTWYLTQTNIAVSAIPSAITNAIENSQYSSLTTEAASKLQRNGMIDAYLVELRNGNNFVYLYYTEDGYLFDKEDESKVGVKVEPTPVPEALAAMVNQNYSGAKIVCIDENDDNYDVTLLKGGTYFHYILNKDFGWIQTEYAQSYQGLPQAVLDGFKRDGYAFNQDVDTVTRIIRPNGEEPITLYRFNIDNSTGKTTVYYDINGTKVNE